MTIWIGERWTWRLVIFFFQWRDLSFSIPMKTCPCQFPSLTSFKILHEFHSRIKQRKRNSGKEIVEKKEPKRREVRKEGKVDEAASENRAEATAWSICNDKWRNFSKNHKSLNCFFYFYSSSKTFNFLEIYNKTMEIFLLARYLFTSRNLVFALVLSEWLWYGRYLSRNEILAFLYQQRSQYGID